MLPPIYIYCKPSPSSPTIILLQFLSYIDAPSVKLARIFCDFVLRKKQVILLQYNTTAASLPQQHHCSSPHATLQILSRLGHRRPQRPSHLHRNGCHFRCSRRCWRNSPPWWLRSWLQLSRRHQSSVLTLKSSCISGRLKGHLTASCCCEQTLSKHRCTRCWGY